MASSLLSLRRRAEERREVPRSEVAEISFGSWMEVADAVERRIEMITENFIVAVCCFCCFVCTVLISFRVVGTLFPSVGECLLLESVVCVGTRSEKEHLEIGGKSRQVNVPVYVTARYEDKVFLKLTLPKC
jgi:hypothetical protein